MDHFMRDGRGSATRWFALAAVALSAASMAGAHTLDWLSQSGRIAVVAYHAPAPLPATRTAADGVDPMPTGSIGRSALMIRLR